MRLRPFAPAFAPPRCYVRAYVIVENIGILLRNIGRRLKINLMLLCWLGLRIINYEIENP